MLSMLKFPLSGRDQQLNEVISRLLVHSPQGLQHPQLSQELR